MVFIDLEQAAQALNRSVDARGIETARSQTFEVTALAVVNLRAGERQAGLDLGSRAINLAGGLRSVRVLDRLTPLAIEAAKLSSTDGTDLARAISTLQSA